MYFFLQQCTVTFCNSSPSDTDSVVYSIDRNTADNLPCDQRALGYFKNEIKQGNKRLLLKGMYIPSKSLSQTYPIGATEFQN